MSLSQEEFARLVTEANLAPSVHNTQPTRWRLELDGSVLVLEDIARRLPVGDPTGRDADVSHGAAIEGFVLGAAACGLAVTVEPLHAEALAGLRPVARLVLKSGAPPDPLRDQVPVRRTFRGAFARTSRAVELAFLHDATDVRIVQSPAGIRQLAELNDVASLRTFRDGAFRAELLSWMRLSPGDPDWSLDGLNAEAMAMSPFEAAAAGFVLRPGVFEGLDRIGAARALVAEAKVVRSSEAIILFHRAHDESPLETGRRFYRLWLECTVAGLAMAPMAVVADDKDAQECIRIAFDIPPKDRLITAFRLGMLPRAPRSGPKPRLPMQALVVQA